MVTMCLHTMLGNAPNEMTAGVLRDLPPDLDNGRAPGQCSVLQQLPPYSRYVRLDIIMHQEEPRAHSTSVGSDIRPKDFILIPNCQLSATVPCSEHRAY